MKLNAILAHVRKMKDRDGLKQIMNAAEARDSKLSNIESDRERKRLWEQVSKLGIAKGDTVYIHTGPTKHGKLSAASVIKSGDWTFLTGQHGRLWGHPLTVTQVKTRDKEIVVRLPGSTVDHRLSPGVCIKLKLSKKPSSAALSNALHARATTIASPPEFTPRPLHQTKWPKLGKGML